MSVTFDPVAGDAAKRDGMGRAWRGANPEWRVFMLERVKEVAERKPYFFTDDIERLRQERQGPATHENRAIGPLMKSAQKLGYCVPTDDWSPSSQLVNHRRFMRVWRSLIYRGPKVRPRMRPIDPRQFDLWRADA